ncbi:MAG: hypothetical protein WC777_02110 [Candidatus Gracilibacteria bacterium]|jgi:hypothetical protein
MHSLEEAKGPRPDRVFVLPDSFLCSSEKRLLDFSEFVWFFCDKYKLDPAVELASEEWQDQPHPKAKWGSWAGYGRKGLEAVYAQYCKRHREECLYREEVLAEDQALSFPPTFIQTFQEVRKVVTAALSLLI